MSQRTARTTSPSLQNTLPNLVWSLPRLVACAMTGVPLPASTKRSVSSVRICAMTETVKRCSRLRLTENSGCRKSIALGCTSLCFRRAGRCKGLLVVCHVGFERSSRPSRGLNFCSAFAGAAAATEGAGRPWVRLTSMHRTGKPFS